MVEGIQDENLLEFSKYQKPFLRVFYNQAYNGLSKREDNVLSESQIEQMADFYAIAKCYYYWGRAVEIAEEMKSSQLFSMWQEYGLSKPEPEYLEYILEEATPGL